MLLAHLTDIHVADVADYAGPGEEVWHAKVRKHSPEMLDALLADLANQRPDHVVLSGDITQTSRAGEFRRARGHLDRHLAGLPISVLPGNHDRWSADGLRLFDESFGDLARCELGARDFPRCRLAGDVALLLLDSAPHVPGEDPASVKGHVARAQLERLPALAAKLAGRFLVVVLHHHLRLSAEDAAKDDPRDPTPLENAPEVEAALARIPVGLVLHGHRHKAMRLDLAIGDRTVPVLCPGSGTRVHDLADRTGRYNLYRIDAGALTEVRTRAFRPGDRAFHEA
jgi:3',5'-cyclic AMP phosphodiesterase CpdA